VEENSHEANLFLLLVALPAYATFLAGLNLPVFFGKRLGAWQCGLSIHVALG